MSLVVVDCGVGQVGCCKRGKDVMGLGQLLGGGFSCSRDYTCTLIVTESISGSAQASTLTSDLPAVMH